MKNLGPTKRQPIELATEFEPFTYNAPCTHTILIESEDDLRFNVRSDYSGDRDAIIYLFNCPHCHGTHLIESYNGRTPGNPVELTERLLEEYHSGGAGHIVSGLRRQIPQSTRQRLYDKWLETTK